MKGRASTNAGSLSAQGEVKPFVWPPAPLPDADGPAPAAAPTPSLAPPAQPPVGRLARWLRDMEAFWLAPTALPLARRMQHAAWAPDPLDAFCNRCAQTVGFGEDDEFGCAKCRGRRLAWPRAVRLGAFEGDLASWVKEVKFTANASLGIDLGRLLAARLREAGLPRERVCVVPVPMSRLDRLTREHDHARTIAAGVARGLGAPLVRALSRRHGPSQRAMGSVAARERNVKRAFRAGWRVDCAGWTVVLVDDVMTTGATMRAASRALWPRSHAARPAAIWAAAVAVTPEHAGRATAPDGSSGGPMA